MVQDVTAEQRRIGSRIKKLCGDAGLTQAELATRAEMSLDGVSRILLGKRTPNLQSLIKLGKALGVDYRVLLEDPERGRDHARPLVARATEFLAEQPDDVVVAAQRHAEVYLQVKAFVGRSFEQAAWELMWNLNCNSTTCSATSTFNNDIFPSMSDEQVLDTIGTALGYALAVSGGEPTYGTIWSNMYTKILGDVGSSEASAADSVMSHHGI